MTIAETVREYLNRHPDEAARLEPLTSALAAGTDVGDRHGFDGHVTCGAVIIDPDGRVLLIRHVVLDRWLLPGGHLEPADPDLIGAALREAEEETGLGPDVLDPLSARPIDVDVHRIPPRPDRGEPEHWHFDFRYAFRLRRHHPVTVPAAEVSAYEWAGPDALPDGLAGKLAALTRRSVSAPR